MLPRYRTARTIVRLRRLARTHRTAARSVGAAGLSGALLLGGIGMGAVSLAAADPGSRSVVDHSEASSLASDATDDASEGPFIDPDTGELIEPQVGDDEEVAPDAEVDEISMEQLAIEIAQQDAELERRAAQIESKVKAKQLRSRVIEIARDQIGDPYVAGRSGPDAFDCSGFTRYVFKHAMDKVLPHYSRAQYAKVKRVKLEDAQPGDLVFFFRRGAHHVGIYIGNGKMIDAPGRGRKVRVSPISGDWWSRSLTGIGRIIDPV